MHSSHISLIRTGRGGVEIIPGHTLEQGRQEHPLPGYRWSGMDRGMKRLYEDRERRQELHFDVLIRQLQNETIPYRIKAAEALGRARDPRAVEPLISVLSADEQEVRFVVIRVLGQLGDPRATTPLIECLRDDDHWTRRGAAWSLGEIGDPQAVRPLIDALGDPKDPVRLEAVAALGKIGSQNAAPAVRAVCEGDPAPDVRTAARTALRQIQSRQSGGM